VEPLAALGPDDADMLVCGSRGYGQVRRVLLGGLLAADPRRPAARYRPATGSYRVRRVAAGSVDPVSSELPVDGTR
jgi:hypothetical protein